MLSKENPLFFPKLKLIREDQLVHRKNKNEISGRPINIYKLDWTEQEKIIQNDHEKWAKKCWPDKNIPFVGQLPEEWDNWVKELVLIKLDNDMIAIGFITYDKLWKLGLNVNKYQYGKTLTNVSKWKILELE